MLQHSQDRRGCGLDLRRWLVARLPGRGAGRADSASGAGEPDRRCGSGRRPGFDGSSLWRRGPGDLGLRGPIHLRSPLRAGVDDPGPERARGEPRGRRRHRRAGREFPSPGAPRPRCRPGGGGLAGRRRGGAASALRRKLRDARLPFGGEVAYSTAPAPRPDPPSGFDGSDDTCNHYDACVGRNRSRCQRYAQDEMAFVILASDQGCIWVAVLSGTATSNPLIGLGAGALCQFISSGLRRYLESAFEENCLVTTCGTYPYCI